MDFFVFNVKPGCAGWPSHRDRAGGTKVGFWPNGLPQYTTIWFAITDASPQTSCIYVLPAHADPKYKNLRVGEREEDTRLTIANRHQHIHALPVTSGTVLAWSHRILHWGSASPP